MTRNTKLFYEIADKVEAEPACFNQKDWGSKCGTQHCIAGWAAALSGYDPVPDLDDVLRWSEVTRGQSAPADIHAVARQLLGISEMESDTLFAGGWRPVGATVPDALRFFGDGGSIL